MTSIDSALTHHLTGREQQDFGDDETLFYYVSAVDGRRFSLVAGPYPTCELAERKVQAARDLASQYDPRGCFAAWGVCRANFQREGVLNKFLRQYAPEKLPSIEVER